MAEDVPDRDGIHRHFQRRIRLGLVRDDHLSPKFGQVLFHRVVHVGLALVHQDHECGGGHRFGHESYPEQGVLRHGLVGRDVGMPHGIEDEDAVPWV